MLRKTFGKEIQQIKDELLLLSSMVEQAVMDSVEALKNNDLEQAHQILLRDLDINQKRFEIEISILALMATQQPIAYDLRFLAASLGICTELERMWDYAKGIATINLRSERPGFPLALRHIYSMGEQVVDMLHRAMTAFVDEDKKPALALIYEDDVIDKWYRTLYNEAINSVLGDPRNIERVNYVIWAAHNLERLGDRVTNICERVVYVVTGERPIVPPIPKESKLSLDEL